LCQYQYQSITYITCMKKIILAPNAFKGSLSATEVAIALEKGLRLGGFTGNIHCCPVGDGGDGTGDLLRNYLKANSFFMPVQNPIGKLTKAPIGWIASSHTAIIEMADASGLRLLNPQEYNPLKASSFGLGQLIKAALDREAREIIICIGGSATVDGGVGMLAAIGIRFINKFGGLCDPDPVGIQSLETIDTTTLDPRIHRTKLVVLCDVKNKLLGPNGAATVFGPQKGANPDVVNMLENSLTHLDKIVFKQTSANMRALPFGGAAGGVAAALNIFCNASLVEGIDYFLQCIHFDEILEDADWVITGEGAIDAQTLEGKAPFGVAKMAKKKHIPVIAVAGSISEVSQSRLGKYFQQIININQHHTTLKEAIRNTRKNLIKTASELKIAD